MYYFIRQTELMLTYLVDEEMRWVCEQLGEFSLEFEDMYKTLISAIYIPVRKL
jgi:hypothetical protein